MNPTAGEPIGSRAYRRTHNEPDARVAESPVDPALEGAHRDGTGPRGYAS